MYRSATDKTGRGITETGQRVRSAKHTGIFETKISELKAGFIT